MKKMLVVAMVVLTMVIGFVSFKAMSSKQQATVNTVAAVESVEVKEDQPILNSISYNMNKEAKTFEIVNLRFQYKNSDYTFDTSKGETNIRVFDSVYSDKGHLELVNIGGQFWLTRQ